MNKKSPILEEVKKQPKSRVIRSKSIKIRVSDQELQQLKDRQVGDELATWIRSVCLNTALPSNTAMLKNQKKIIRIVDPNLMRELGKIGGNLNQIAKQANTLNSPLEKVKVFALLAEIQNQLNQLLANYNDH